MLVGPGNGSPPRVELRVDGWLVPRRLGLEIHHDARSGVTEAFWTTRALAAWGVVSRRVARLAVGSRVTEGGVLIHVEGAMERLRVQDVAPAGVAGPPEGGFAQGGPVESPLGCSGEELLDRAHAAVRGARAHGASSGRDERVWRLSVGPGGERQIALNGTGWPGDLGLTKLEGEETIELVPAAELERLHVERERLRAEVDLLRAEGDGLRGERARLLAAGGELLGERLRSHGRLQEPA